MGMESVIGAGRDGRHIAIGWQWSVGPPRASRPAAHCDRNDACRGAGEWRDLDLPRREWRPSQTARERLTSEAIWA